MKSRQPSAVDGFSIWNTFLMIDTLKLLKPLEDELLSQANGQVVHWCRRGTTAGAWAFKAAALNHPEIAEPEVIIPSTACSTMPAAALIAGCKIRFADVNLSNALPTLDSIIDVLNENSVAVLFIHMFGNTADLSELHNVLKKRGIWLVEDAAQAFGGHTPSGKHLGSTGEMTLHGFTDNKILESGGGALLVRDSACVPLVAEAKRLLPHPGLIARELYLRLERSFQSIYNGLVEFQRIRFSQADSPQSAMSMSPDTFSDVILSFTDWFMQGEPPTIRLSYERRNLETSIEHRLKMAELYRQLIPAEIGVPINRFDESGNCWRYTILLKEPYKQDDFIASLRRRGYQATDLYWSLDTLLDENPICKNALELGKRVVNLPVDKGVNEEMVREMVTVMKAKGSKGLKV